MSRSFREREERRRREREAERAERRAEERREEARERAREEEREREREEENRREALERAKEFEAAEQKARERRERVLARARAVRREARRAERRDEREAEERRVEARDERLAEHAAEQRRVQRADERLAATREERRAATAEAERTEERRAEAMEERRAEAAERDRAEARIEERRATAHDERRAEARAREREEARREETRAALRSERHGAARESEQQAELRAEARSERREAAQAEDREHERQEARRAEIRAATRREQAEAQRRREEAAERRRELAGARARDRSATLARREQPAQRIPSGAISGSLSWLRVRGSRLVDEHGGPVTLRGVTASALERATAVGETFAPALTEGDVAALAELGVNAVAVPIAQDLALAGSGDAEPEDYLEALDGTIESVAGAGMYAIVQLSVVSPTIATHVDAGGERFEPALPTPESLDLMGVLGRRYEGEPAVLFDLFRSPHHPGAGDATATLVRRITWDLWYRWLLALLGELRREHPRAIAFARGLRRGRDLSGFPLAYTDGSHPPGLVYAADLGGEERTATLAEIERLVRRHVVAAFFSRDDPPEPAALEALGRRLAALGCHWIGGDWR